MPYNVAKGRPQNYADVHDALPAEEQLAQKTVKGVRRTRCDCGRFVQAFRIADTRDLPAEVTMGQKWSCDNCWTAWIRHDPGHQRSYQGRPFRMLDWLELHGAPASNIARQIANDVTLHARMRAKRQEIADAARGPADEGRDRELARLDDNINRMLDKVRSPAPAAPAA